MHVKYGLHKNVSVLNLVNIITCGLYLTTSISALYWLSYESMKAHVLLQRGSSQMTFSESFTAGAVSGTVSTYMSRQLALLQSV